MKSSKPFRNWPTSLPKAKYGIHIRVNVLLHELYPVKQPSKASPTNQQFELSSQDFIQALRKMDLEDNTNEEEVNFLFDTNHLPLSSFSPSCSSHRPNAGPSTTLPSTPSEDSLSQNALPSPLDPLWLVDDKVPIRPMITPTSSNTPSSPESQQPPSKLPGHIAADPVDSVSVQNDVSPPQFTPVPIKIEEPMENNAYTSAAASENVEQSHLQDILNEADRTMATNRIPTPADQPVPGLSDSCVVRNPRTTSKSCSSNSKSFNIFEFDRSMSALTSSSSDSEVDYRTENGQRKSKTFMNHRKFHYGSSSLASPNTKLEDQDRYSCTSSLDSVALGSRSHPYSTYCGSSKSEHHLRDMDTFVRAKIPFSYEEVIQASNESFREMRASFGLTDYQISVMLDVRKRAANRLAAERCRRLKIATRDELAEQLASLRLERQLLQRQVAQARQRKQKASDSLLDEQKRVLRLLRGSDGSQLKYTDWRVRLTHDDEVVVVAAGR